jgi:hypothetical protein
MKTPFLVFVMLTLCGLSACTWPVRTPTPAPVQSLLDLPDMTPLPTLTLGPTATAIPPTPDPEQAANYTGPYAVVKVAADDTLKIRAAAGIQNAIIGSFAPAFNGITRTGKSVKVGEEPWYEIQRPEGGSGWVSSSYLTEYTSPATFCVDDRVNALLNNLKKALDDSNGKLLASLVSPTHGVDVWLWRNGKAINFDREHIAWVFESTYRHTWGANTATGVQTIGAFHEAVLPNLRDGFGQGYELRCNEREVPGVQDAWPGEYANVNVYKLVRPGAPDANVGWRIWLVGVEYVRGKPFLFGLVHFQ